MKNSLLQNTATHLGDRVSDISEKVSEFVTDNTVAARERIEDARRGVAAQVRTTRHAVRKHPLESVLIAVGVGVALGALSGLLIGRRR